MPEALKYIVNNHGHKTSVLVPVKVWKDLNDNYQKLQKKLNVLSSVTEGLNEVKQTKHAGRKLQTLKDFLK